MKEFKINVKDGHQLFLRVWTPELSPKGMIHILHGMAEHSLRYDAFAKYLNFLGFVVVAHDHRGHGFTKEEDEKGWFAEKNGWAVVLQDAYEIEQLMRKEYPSLPLILFGHSMGSFMARSLIGMHPGFYDAVVISGTGASQGIIGKIGKRIALSHAKKVGSKTPDKMMHSLSFGSFNKKIQNPKTGSDWLSKDEEMVKKYEDDPLCGFVCSSQFYADLLDGIALANSKDNASKIPSSLPMLLISGAEDPVGGFAKGVKKVYSLYKNVGLSDVTLTLIDGDRHEILNEVGREKTQEKIGLWILSRVGIEM